MSRVRHKPQGALCLPGGCTANETLILQLRARGANYREISRATKIAPRKVWDTERAALVKVLRYLETAAFLGVQ